MNQIIREDMERITEDPFFQQLAGSRILITGATGLIGSLTVKACLRYNETHDTKISVIGMIRNRKKAEEVFEAALTNPHLELVEGDLRKPLEVPVTLIIFSILQALQLPSFLWISRWRPLRHPTGEQNMFWNLQRRNSAKEWSICHQWKCTGGRILHLRE